MKKNVLRNFIDPILAMTVFYNCEKHHTHVNQHIQCRSKVFQPFKSPNLAKL